MPKIVFSRSLAEPLPWPNSTRVEAADAAAGLDLKARTTSPMRVIGSLSLVRELAAWGVLDRLRVLVFPLVLGVTGREPAFAGYPDVELELVGSRVLDGRISLLDYRMRGGPTEPRD